MFLSGSIQNSQSTPRGRKKWRYCQGKSFIGTSDTARHLKTFRIISNEKLILFLILCQ